MDQTGSISHYAYFKLLLSKPFNTQDFDWVFLTTIDKDCIVGRSSNMSHPIEFCVQLCQSICSGYNIGLSLRWLTESWVLTLRVRAQNYTLLELVELNNVPGAVGIIVGVQQAKIYTFDVCVTLPSLINGLNYDRRSCHLRKPWLQGRSCSMCVCACWL